MRIAFLIILAAGCGGTSDSHRTPNEYTGCAQDEQFRLFDDSEVAVTVDDTQSPQITQPDITATIPYSPKPIFQWNQDPNDVGQRDGDVPYMDGVNGCNACCPQFNQGALTTVHVPAISGNMYDLHFYIGDSYNYRLITTFQEWAPPDELWLSWRGKSLSVQIYRADVLVNQIKEGPFTSTQPIKFKVGS